MSRKRKSETDPVTGEVPIEGANDQTEAPKPTETKAQRFARLAPPRVDKLLARLKQIKALANRGNYEFTARQKAEMLDTIREAVVDCVEAFEKEPNKKGSFSFSDPANDQ